ncbi:flagellar assembly protein FliX [Salinarimonas soli]|uniref:Flagellar assembly protein fliX n=1 Tax=Salinarimonas soli TaxID=1638099 RepID=A0A5B2VZF7_9HYPH|nr:flagellar assembly protein FliX [Salinarimonas soli]KAA2244184.1 flagellar assembly protein fliX [Salinarimonas soli]
MRVDPKFFAPPLTAAAPQRRAAGAERFSPTSGASAAKTSGPAASAPLATMDAILALQGEGDPGERRRRSLKRGHDLLDALDRLKAGLLAGRIGVGDLKALVARLAERGETTGDPGLDDLLAHIELRAQVEIAKLAAR